MEFPVSNTNPTEVYGLPKTVETEVRARASLVCRFPMGPLHAYIRTVPAVIKTVFGRS